MFLMRSLGGTDDDVSLLVMSFSMQDYIIPLHDRQGPAGIAVLTTISDMRATSADYQFAVAIGYPYELLKFQAYVMTSCETSTGFWLLDSVPRTDTENVKHIQTASRTGFYINAATDQSNIKNLNWELSTNPLKTLSKWQWEGRPILVDSWAWVHCLHLLLAGDMAFNIGVLFLVVRQSFASHRIWVGDAFVSISTTLMSRGILVLLAWYFNEFWTLTEFCLHDANEFMPVQKLFIHPEVVKANLLTGSLTFTGAFASLIRERIDPAFAVFIFEIAFTYRLTLDAWFPALVKSITSYATKDYNLGTVAKDEALLRVSPFHSWTVHRVSKTNLVFILTTLAPGLVVMSSATLLLALLRKVYRHYHPDPMLIQKVTGYSEDEKALMAQKQILTQFEIATGAELLTRYGLVSDYDNYLYIKGMKFASADGIYNNGFVIVNSKFLVATEDLKSIIFIKLLRFRFTNIFVYDVNGTSVKQTARLVYPHTMSWHDLVHLNISTLS